MGHSLIVFFASCRKMLDIKKTRADRSARVCRFREQEAYSLFVKVMKAKPISDMTAANTM